MHGMLITPPKSSPASADQLEKVCLKMPSTNAKTASEDMRVQHFERLNGYRLSQEFQAYAREIGRDVPTGNLPSLLGNKWEITEEIYDEFLNMLPPLGWRGNTFYMSEFAFADITSKFTKEGDRYYCEHARYPGVSP